MQLLVTSDSSSLSYWLNGRVLLCALWVLTPMFIALFVIWKYDRIHHLESEKGRREERAQFLQEDEAWRTCVKEIHPMFLLVFRLVSFFLLLGTLILDVVVHGGSILYYYTQWTFTLVTIYFGLGSALSIYGCYQHYSMCRGINGHRIGIDAEQGLYVPLAYGETANGIKLEINSNNLGNSIVQKTAGIWSYIFQVLFQMSAGAVMLTDCIYWFVIFPFLTIKDYEMNYLTVITHSLNAVMLLGDTALNCMRFPWIRISYFILLTGVYVFFQWLVHACISIWWPYPFLDLSLPDAPLWYLLVALMHIPCYGVFALIMEIKHYLLSRCFPQSYQCIR